MKSILVYNLSAVAMLFIQASVLEAFTIAPDFGKLKAKINNHKSSLLDSLETQHDNFSLTAVRAPLKFVGPYPCLGLRFPNLATRSQKARNVTGVSLDFVLDTAANTNTINAQVAQELSLEVVGSALPGVSSAGMITGGDTFVLGDAQLEGIGGDNSFTFIQNLSASALPIASPASAGLLSLAFFHCFEGGVEFEWGSPTKFLDGMLQNPPSITFYGENDNMHHILKDMTRVCIHPIPVTQLPSVIIEINGVQMPALLDSGSPITVLNSKAASQAGVETIELVSERTSKKSLNPFAAIGERIKEAQSVAQASARGDVLTIAGTHGRPVNLLKSKSEAKLSLVGGDGEDVDFGSRSIYVGEIPGLAALNGIGVDSPPAVVLGMDVLRSRPKMLLRARDNELYF